MNIEKSSRERENRILIGIKVYKDALKGYIYLKL